MLYQLSYSRPGAGRLVAASGGVKRYCTRSVYGSEALASLLRGLITSTA
jgi:hypothetical protein